MKPRYKKKIGRSPYEEKIMADLERRGIAYEYESLSLRFGTGVCKHCGEPNRIATYTPDFVFNASIPIVVEAKGLFSAPDRKKMQAVKKDNPQAIIRILFDTNSRIGKSPFGRTKVSAEERAAKDKRKTYGDWCDKHGFEWGVGTCIPISWTK